MQSQTRPLLVSRGWLQAVALVFVFGFLVLGLLAYGTYTGEAPIPVKITATTRCACWRAHSCWSPPLVAGWRRACGAVEVYPPGGLDLADQFDDRG